MCVFISITVVLVAQNITILWCWIPSLFWTQWHWFVSVETSHNIPPPSPLHQMEFIKSIMWITELQLFGLCLVFVALLLVIMCILLPSYFIVEWYIQDFNVACIRQHLVIIRIYFKRKSYKSLKCKVTDHLLSGQYFSRLDQQQLKVCWLSTEPNSYLCSLAFCKLFWGLCDMSCQSCQIY